MKLVRCIGLALLVILVGCSSERNLSYLNSHNGKNLVINAPLSAQQLDKGFVLSSVGKIAPQGITPPELK
tara:strand:+ start:664 stop:873 length:210 start_codon:yes stop_codon:yes gene_type:complete